ncbi:baseplate multidomain protein megatron [Flaviflagellibacter deserti]|uniref:Glycoside hydrolase/phage tail family protein n=1 Tax=Flaviflagellibacter deserti TaxID=2267266 RepID=A0ABV9Z039_9HYPH
MATLVLQAAGAAVGSLFGPVGAMVGRAVGGLAGAAIDRSFLGGGSTQSGGRLRELDVTASTEGTPIPRAWGRVRVSGQIIWATRLVAKTRRENSSGGKGAPSGPSVETTSYFANVALGLCQGPIAHVGRVWADGKPLDLTRVNMRTYIGDEAQAADPLIVAKEGAENAPAYRGLAYVVFENLLLEAFGNRVPQLSFEVIRPVGMLEPKIRSVCLIPGATEFGYDTIAVTRKLGIGRSAAENRQTLVAGSNLEASLDELVALCPNLEHVSLVVAWFGDDLRCGHCTVAPRVDSKIKQTVGAAWSVGSLGRGGARLVSEHDGRPAYGGSPSDGSVLRAIAAIKARGLKVTLYPFLMMDVPADNDLPDPVTGVVPQRAYPWRGEISAVGDGTAAAGSEVAAFFGTAAAGHFSSAGGAVFYSGPSEWGWRRFVLHVAQLGEIAGGVDAIVIGSEFRTLTRVRNAAGAYPAVAQLVSLASAVRTLVGPATKITYAADWTEYGSHVLGGGMEVRFPLDPLWAHPAVDAVGIDFYGPLADWRDGTQHLDRGLAESICDSAYLEANVAGGESYDWFYASDADRAAQVRTPISDGLGKPWTFRAKDLHGWWSNPHHERVDGVELSSATAWVPGSKPIWLIEIGCPAVDKGANAPNVFPDEKSASALPPFSSGGRDDLVQRRAIEAVMAVYGEAATNPLSPVYGGRMVDPERTSVWAWDARPFPAFPIARDVWADGAAYETGHWLNGRLGQAPLAELTAAVLGETDAEAFETGTLEGVIDGYAVDRPASAREVLEPLGELYAFGACERDGAIVLSPRGRGEAVEFDDLAAQRDGAEPNFVRAQETELPVEIAIGHGDVLAEFRPVVASARRRETEARGVLVMDTAVVAAPSEMQRRADIRLQDLWIGRETAGFALPPTLIGPEPGDLVRLDGRTFEITEIADGPLRQVTARAVAPEIFEAPRLRDASIAAPVPSLAGLPEVVVLDLPAPDGEPPVLSRVAVAAKPWPGAIVLWRESGGAFEPAVRVSAPALIGETLDALKPGRPWRFDNGGSVTVAISDGELVAVTEDRLLAGANLAALRGPDGAWEVLQFGEAELVAERTYRLSRLLRGQSGTEIEAGVEKPAGSVFVLLDAAVVPLAEGVERAGRPVTWRAAPAATDHADPMAVEFAATPSSLALMPFAPVHLRGRRTSAGVEMSWIRRTRSGGDSWEVAEVPLAEESEAYRVEVLDGGEVVRTINVLSPSALYTNADETADFGGPQESLSIRVMQISALAGAGRAAETILHV